MFEIIREPMDNSDMLLLLNGNNYRHAKHKPSGLSFESL